MNAFEIIQKLVAEIPCCGCCCGDDAYVELALSIIAPLAGSITTEERHQLVSGSGWGAF